MTDEQTIREAFAAGEAAAQAIKVGDEFTGAWGAARAAGIDPQSTAGKIFTNAYLASLPGNIWTSLDSDRVTKITPKR